MPPTNKNTFTPICPVHEEFKERVNRLGTTTEKEDDELQTQINTHETRLQQLENNYSLIISNQILFQRIMTGVLIVLTVSLIFWFINTFIIR